MLESERHLVSIVDDDPSAREATTSLLRANGFVAQSFSSAYEFLNSPDLEGTECLVLDLRMPGMGGLELQRHLEVERRLIPIVFVTAHGTAETREQAKSAGAIDFLAKPVSEDALLSAVRVAFERTQNVNKIKLAESFLSALRTRDWDLLRSLMTENVTWSLAGQSLISGEAKGVESVIQRAQTIVSYGLTFTLKHILVGKHGVALSLHNTARRGNLFLDEHLTTVFGLRDQKIATISTYLSDVEMVNTFFVSFKTA